MGACHGGSCQPIVCGDGIVDPGEACDDHNTAAGDGCSETCDSTEVCGNGTTDLVNAEQCDSGVPQLSNDGCSSRCALESDTWRDVTPNSISPRGEFSMVHDVARDELVLFGGATSSDLLDGTWIYDGAWRRHETANAPSARADYALAYDSARERVVLFGGVGANGQLGDTWEWDGLDWTERHRLTSPPAQSTAVAAYDSARQRVVLLAQGTDPVDATWEWDGEHVDAACDDARTLVLQSRDDVRLDARTHPRRWLPR